MARVTVEDCVGAVPNRFDLVLLSAQRARELSAGADALVAPDKDKNAVIALREIADKAVVPAEVQENIVKSLQMRTVQEEMEQETVRAFAARRRQLSTASHDAPETSPENPDAPETDKAASAQAAESDAPAETESQSADNKEAAEKAEEMPEEKMTEERILGELRKQSESSRSEHEMRGGDE